MEKGVETGGSGVVRGHEWGQEALKWSGDISGGGGRPDFWKLLRYNLKYLDFIQWVMGATVKIFFDIKIFTFVLVCLVCLSTFVLVCLSLFGCCNKIP